MKSPLGKKILFLRVKNKDKEAFGKFYDLYVTRIYRFIFFKVNSTTDAQDLTSEVFLKLWQYIKEDKEIENLNSLTYMIARNAVIDFYRHKSRKDESIEGAGLETIINEKDDLFERQAINSDLMHVLEGLGGLKDEYREVIVLRYLDELSIDEIAQILDKSAGSVRVLLHRATKTLKDTVVK